MSVNTTASGEWWADISVSDSEYVPGSFSAGPFVEASHDIFVGLRNNNFDPTDSDYTHGLLALFVFFMVVGVLAIYSSPCLSMYLSKSYGERLAEGVKNGEQSIKRRKAIFLLTGITAMATVAGTVWGLKEADVGISMIEDAVQDIASDFRTVLNLPKDTSHALEGVSAAYDALLNVTCTSIYPKLILSSIGLSDFINEAHTEIESLSTDALDDLADEVQGVSEAVKTVKGIRNGVVWPLISFSIVAIFLFTALETVSIFAWNVNNCVVVAKIITPCSIFLATVIWFSAAAAISMGALSGDFCIDPGTNVEMLVGDTDKMTAFASYYTGNCSTENVIVGGTIAAQEISVSTMNSTIPALYKLVEFCQELSTHVQDVDYAMYNLWTVLEHAGELSSCETINRPYQEAVYDQLCTKLPEGLLVFWLSCVILAVLLLVLAIQWNIMLRARRAVAQAPAIDTMEQQHQCIDIFVGWWSSVSPSRWWINPREDVDTQDVSPAPQRAEELSTPQRLECGVQTTPAV